MGLILTTTIKDELFNKTEQLGTRSKNNNQLIHISYLYIFPFAPTKKNY